MKTFLVAQETMSVLTIALVMILTGVLIGLHFLVKWSYSKSKVKIKPRFILHPGYVKCFSDGEVRYVSYNKLIEYYGLRDIGVRKLFNTVNYDALRMGYYANPSDIHLWPREEGDYHPHLHAKLKEAGYEN